MIERHKLEIEFKEKVIDKLSDIYKRFEHQTDIIVNKEYQTFLIKRDLEKSIPPDKSYQIVIFLSDLECYFNFKNYFLGEEDLYDKACEICFRQLSRNYNKNDFISIVSRSEDNELELIFEFNLKDDSVIREANSTSNNNYDDMNGTEVDFSEDSEILDDGVDPITFQN